MAPRRRRPHAVADAGFHAFMRAADRAVDALYGVGTRREYPYDDAERARTRHRDPAANMPSYYLRLFALRRFLRPRADDALVDLGSGDGRALFVFARAGVRVCRGVEFDAVACRRARANARRLRAAPAAIEIVEADAADYAFTDETIVYLFNPFGPATLRAVLDRLRVSLAARPRRVRIGYYHPRHREVLDDAGWLRRVATLRGFKTDIAVYETRTLSR